MKNFLMKNKILILASASVMIVTLFFLFFTTKNTEKNIVDVVDAIQIIAEQAYFEGQKDAINGDIRITKINSCYVWTKSPWNNGTNPIFQPDCIEIQNSVDTLPFLWYSWNKNVDPSCE